MLSLTIPKILSNGWFWLAIAVPIIAIHYFFGKPPQPRKVSPFFLKHKDAIRRTCDILLIIGICLYWIPITYMAASIALEPLLYPHYAPFTVAGELKDAAALFSIFAIYGSGSSGVLIGLLSVFQSNLTITKRSILLLISFLPIVFTAILILTTPVEEPQYFWSVIKSGFGSFFGCLVVNGPAIVAGQHFIQVAWLLMRKLKLVSGEFPE